MPGYLIKDTTMMERIQLIKEWIPTEEQDDCGIDLWEMYDPYIKGELEISECNARFNEGFYEVSDLKEAPGCGKGNPRR